MASIDAGRGGPFESAGTGGSGAHGTGGATGIGGDFVTGGATGNGGGAGTVGLVDSGTTAKDAGAMVPEGGGIADDSNAAEEVGAATKDSGIATAEDGAAVHAGEVGDALVSAPPTGEPCTPTRDLSCAGGTDGTGAIGSRYLCFRTRDTIEGWGCAGFSRWTIKINGKVASCGYMGQMTPLQGFTYFELTGDSRADPNAMIFWWGNCRPGPYPPWSDVVNQDGGARDGS